MWERPRTSTGGCTRHLDPTHKSAPWDKIIRMIISLTSQWGYYGGAAACPYVTFMCSQKTQIPWAHRNECRLGCVCVCVCVCILSFPKTELWDTTMKIVKFIESNIFLVTFIILKKPSSLFLNTLMRQGEAESDQCVTGTNLSLGLMTQRRREGEKKLHTEGLTAVSHACLAVSLAMLCQTFLGTVLTLRDFWQSDYESICSNAVSAKTWAESPTAVRAWLAVKLQDEEWAAYIKLVCSLLMDALSASWWCQDFVLGADARTTANTVHCWITQALLWRVAMLMVRVPGLTLAIPESTFQLAGLTRNTAFHRRHEELLK